MVATVLVGGGIHLINQYVASLDFSFNQYVVEDSRAALIHTGSWAMFDRVAAGIRAALGQRDLDYIIVSHFEADECGALKRFLDLYPGAVPVCSEVTARQLRGFGLVQEPLVKKEGDTLELGRRTLTFLAYPSEMHLWDGILPFDPSTGTLFSSDLFVTRGRPDPLVAVGSVTQTVSDIGADRIPAEGPRRELATKLAGLPVRVIAPGHGQVIRAVDR